MMAMVPGGSSTGVRRRRVTAPTSSSSGDSTIIKYRTLGQIFQTGTTGGYAVGARWFVPGWNGNLTNATGPDLIANYSSAKFLPGTTVTWEPSVSFTKTGRIYVAWTDNPEAVVALGVAQAAVVDSTTYLIYSDLVKSLGSVQSFPVWMEKTIQFPTKLRRKRFDVNYTASLSNVDVLDRSMQTAMFVAIEGCGAGADALGQFNFHDAVDVEGLTGTFT
jgi:hypothetical protein